MLPRLVLLGSGPANLHALAYLARHREPAREAIVVASQPSEISPGTLPGLLSGFYRPSEVSLNLERLAAAAGARLVPGEIATINPENRSVKLRDGQILLYNAACLAPARYPATSPVPGATRHARFVHSLDAVMELVPALEAGIAQSDRGIFHIVLAGEGRETLEIALAIKGRLQAARRAEVTVTLLASRATDTESAVAGLPLAAVIGSAVTRVEAGTLTLANGATLRFDALLWTMRESAGSLLNSPDRPASGSVEVNRFLQVEGAPGLFAADDVLVRQGDQLKPLRPDPLEAGSVIGANLLAALAGRGPVRACGTRPRLDGFETGLSTAVLTLGGLRLQGSLALKLKRWRDRRRMQLLSQLTA